MSSAAPLSEAVVESRPATVFVHGGARGGTGARGRSTWRGIVGGCLLHLPRIAWMILDVGLVCGGTALGDTLFVWWEKAPAPWESVLLTEQWHLPSSNLWIANFVLGSAVVLSAGVFGLYEPSTLWARSRVAARCLLTVTLAMAVTWLIMHLVLYSSMSRRAAASGITVFLVGAVAVRLLAHHTIRDVRRGLLVIGQGPLTGSIIRSVRRGSVPGYRLVGLVVNPSVERVESGNGTKSRERAPQELVEVEGPDAGDIPIAGEIGDIDELCRRHDVAEVVVAQDAARNPRHQGAALACLRLGCRVTDEITFYETTQGEVPVSHITPNWFLNADLKGHRREHALVKRAFDVVAASLALVLTAPLWPLAAFAIRLHGAGSTFYSQTRVGQGGRPFTLYKFRTMSGDAERSGLKWATENDPRVTLVGRFLRRTRLDELPQLWNVLKGDMALVGPRPERPEFVVPLASLIPFYNERHLIKPGLTGWAQINYRYGSTVADARRKLQLDLYYVKHTSLELDLVILLRTLGKFFQGAR